MGVNSKVARTLGVASLLAGVMAFAAPMATGAWASQPDCHEDNASTTGDAHQLVHVVTESTSSTSTCPTCPAVDPKKGDHESVQGAISESTKAEKGPKAGTPDTTTCAPVVTPPVVTPPVVTPPVVTPPVLTPPVLTPPVVTPPSNVSTDPSTLPSGNPVVSTTSSGSVVKSSDSPAGNGAPTPASSVSTSSTPAPAPSTSHVGPPSAPSTPDVVSTSPSGLVVHTVVVPTDATPAASTPAVIATQATPNVPTQVLAVSTLRSAPAPTLAYTGASVVKLFVIGFGLVLFGLGLLFGSNRRHSVQL